MAKILVTDFETRSTADLKAQGAKIYSRHRSTEVLCMAYGFDRGEPKLWLPGQECPSEVREHIEANGLVIAHNANFEYHIWNNVLVPRHGFPHLKLERLHCTAAWARAMSLPGSLEGAALAASINHKKDNVGHRVMLQLCKPRTGPQTHPPTFWEPDTAPDKFKILYDYCLQDLRVTQELVHRLACLSQNERKVWELDFRINDRGIQIDTPLVVAAAQIAIAEQERLRDRLVIITNGFVTSFNQHQKYKDWLFDNGVVVESIDKANILEILERKDLPADVREALEIRQEAGKSSVAKLSAMVAAVDRNQRAYELFMYCGAGTGRWAGRRVQLQNLQRPKLKQKQIEEVLALLPKPNAAELIRKNYGRPLHVIADCMRSFLVPAKGKKFICADFSNIEGRVLAWLAGEEWKVNAFREFDADVGDDLYVLGYAKAFHCDTADVDDQKRQIGKVMELAFGFGGGVGSLQTMAKNYGIKVTDEKAEELKLRWRQANPKIVNYWYAVEEAMLSAVRNRGVVFSVGKENRKVVFRVKGSFLCVGLPSGRVMYYPYPRIGQKETPWGEVKDVVLFKCENSITHQWGEAHTYGGSAVENIVQAVARDVQAAAMVRLDSIGCDIVLHTHDEIVSEVDEYISLPGYEAAMSASEPWMAGLPIVAKGWEGKRYRKA